MPDDLVQLHIMIPRTIRDRMLSLAANCPEEYYSTTEAWIKAARQYLETNGLTEEQIGMRKAYRRKMFDDFRGDYNE